MVTLEDPRLAEFRDPPNVERAPAGRDLMAMLLAGELDAAIVGGRSAHADPRVVPLIPILGAARAWHARHQAIQVNRTGRGHGSAVAVPAPSGRRGVPATPREQATGAVGAGEIDTTPFGVEGNRRNLEIVIDLVYRQHMIPRRFTVDELFDPVTRSLG